MIPLNENLLFYIRKTVTKTTHASGRYTLMCIDNWYLIRLDFVQKLFIFSYWPAFNIILCIQCRGEQKIF